MFFKKWRLKDNEYKQYKKEKSIIRIGRLLWLLSFVGLVATTSLSIFGGYTYYKGGSIVAFIISIIFIQVSIFTISCLSSVIKQNFTQHYKILIFFQIALLIVSIKYNWDFFANHDFFTFILVITLDIINIKFIHLSYDLRHLIFFERVNKTNYFDMFKHNLFFSIKKQIYLKYNQNKLSTIEPSKIENVPKLSTVDDGLSTPENGNVIKLSTLSTIDEYIVLNYEDGDIINVTELKEKFGFKKSDRRWNKIREDLKTAMVIDGKLRCKKNNLKNSG